MASPKDPASFPAAFAILVEHFASPDAPPVKQFYPRGADAAKLRFAFYNFKRALRTAGEERNLRVANGIVVKLIDHPQGGASLEFSLRDNADYALDLEAAIRKAQEGQGAGAQPPSGGQSVPARSQGGQAVGGEAARNPAAGDAVEDMVGNFLSRH